MAQAKRNHVPTKFAKSRLRFRQQIETIRNFAIERLLSHIARLIKRIERVSESIVKNCKMRNLLPKEIL